MALSPADVAEVLAALGTFRWESGPYGFTLPGQTAREFERDAVRLERGSGIAGRGGCWALVDIPSGERGPSVTTRRDLRRIILEWLAGPPPLPRAGYVAYAKLNHNRFGDAYIWVERRAKGAETP